jgi:hypothetical protein
MMKLGVTIGHVKAVLDGEFWADSEGELQCVKNIWSLF